MRFSLCAALCILFTLGAIAEDSRSANAGPTETIDFPNTVIQDVLEFYSRRVGKPVFISTKVHGGVTMRHTAPKKEIPDLIRRSLLENNGLAMRELPTGEILVEWSKDPKHPRRPEPLGKPVSPRLPASGDNR